MVERMMEQREAGKGQKQKMFLGFCLLALVVMGGSAAAEDLPDPTRPPANLAPQAAGVMPAGPVLQSVMISPTRRVANISGQQVRVGDSFGDAKVVKITEGEVVLRSGDGLQTLKLFPDVDKRNTLEKPAGAKHKERTVR